MKKFDLDGFTNKIIQEIREFEENQLSYTSSDKKTMQEWVDSFLVFAGYSDEDEDEEEYLSEEYDDDFYYDDSFEYQQVINRKKYRSFRDDDMY